MCHVNNESVTSKSLYAHKEQQEQQQPYCEIVEVHLFRIVANMYIYVISSIEINFLIVQSAPEKKKTHKSSQFLRKPQWFIRKNIHSHKIQFILFRPTPVIRFFIHSLRYHHVFGIK